MGHTAKQKYERHWMYVERKKNSVFCRKKTHSRSSAEQFGRTFGRSQWLFLSWMPFSEICHILKKNAKIVETGKFIKVSWSTILTKKKEQTSMGCFKNNGLFIQLLTLTRCLFISHFVFRRQRVEFFFSTKA